MAKKRPGRITKDAIKKTVARKKEERLWRWESGLTYSSMTKFLENPEEFYLGYVLGFTSKRLKKGLEFGSIFHLMLEHQFTGKKKRSPVTVAKEIALAYETGRAKNILKTERETLHILCEQARMLFPIYCDWWKENDEEVTWVAREQKFEVPYDFTDGNNQRRTILLRGMRDGIFTNNEGMGVFETKTKDQIDQNTIRSQLRADMQTLLYLFTACIEQKKMLNQVIYNVVRRPGQQHKNETVSNFIARIKKDVEGRLSHYFMRWEVSVEKKDYEKFERETLLPVLRLFTQWYDSTYSKKNRFDSPYHLTNLNALVGRYGPSDFWEMIVNGRQSLYYRRSLTFPELESPSPVK